jgi:hypothetical protein
MAESGTSAQTFEKKSPVKLKGICLGTVRQATMRNTQQRDSLAASSHTANNRRKGAKVQHAPFGELKRRGLKTGETHEADRNTK